MKSTRLRRLLYVAGTLMSALPGSMPADTPPALAAPAATTRAPMVAAKPAVPPAFLSRVTAAICAGLPAWKSQPSAVPALPLPGPTRDAAGREIVVLPQVTVHGPRPLRLKEEDILTPKALAAKQVKEELSDFDADFLNRFTLPIVGISREARARALYDQRQMRDALDELAFFDQLTRSAGGSP